MIKEKIRIAQRYGLRYSGSKINYIEFQGNRYYSIYQLIEIFISIKDSKDYLKKNLKRDNVLAGVYKNFVRYDLDSKKTAMINASGFNVIISFLANQSLDDIKNYIDMQADPIKTLDELIQTIVQDINSQY